MAKLAVNIHANVLYFLANNQFVLKQNYDTIEAYLHGDFEG